ncbi:MAG: MBL fold metallo-hydrolase [Bacteroidales bacterium]|nr:MBL fold metallo-hydrolase [Bacteroidales bacterium]
MNKIYLVLSVNAILFQGCNMDITPGNKRTPNPQSLEISENISLSTWGPVFFFKHDFFPASFLLKTYDKTLYLDPLLIDNGPPADYILITHNHLDHLSVSDIHKLLKSETIIMGPKAVVKKLTGMPDEVTVKLVEPGDTLDLGEIHCVAVPAYSKGLPTHPKSAKNVGYILSIDNEKIYFTGDTDVIPEMETYSGITVALIPIDGGQFTMDTKSAAMLVNRMKPKICIPMHYELGKDCVEEFIQFADSGIYVHEFRY